MGLLLFWTSALSAAIYGLYQLAFEPGENSVVDMLLVSAGLFWAGALLLPSVANSLSRLVGRPILNFRFEKLNNLFIALLLLAIYIAAVVVGHLAIQVRGWPLIGLPPIHVLAATIPLGLLLWSAIRNLDLGSAQRRWGALASGLTLAPGLAIIFEILAGGVLLLIGAIYIAFNPELSNSLDTVQNLEFLPPELLRDPVIVTLLLANFAIAVPLIEELTKPIAVWLLMWKRPLTPASGFGLGLLSGAGFALLENLLSGASVNHWAGTTTVRIGATAFHLATSALMGWALVRAKNEGRIFLLMGVYSFNILLHGLWNGIVVFFSLRAADTSASSAFLPFELPVISSFVLLLIAIVSIAILAAMNRRLQPTTGTIKTKPSSSK